MSSCSEGVRQFANIVLPGVLEAGMPIHSVALYSHGQAACEQ